MLNQEKVMAFAATCQARRAREFYEKTLGLPVVYDDDHAFALDANGTTIRIQKVRQFTPQPFTALGWVVSDIAATVDLLAARGVTFERYPGLEQDERGIWRAPGGARIAWFEDPDGNILSLTQL
jgi:catechol 2,3-dioxygenase-like lactoylglutathione lyase family enzyme